MPLPERSFTARLSRRCEQDFNSLDAQREACEAYIKSQAHEGWRLVRDRYDDGGYSGGSMVRPAA
jgi:site-specific DNA recombinase